MEFRRLLAEAEDRVLYHLARDVGAALIRRKRPLALEVGRRMHGEEVSTGAEKVPGTVFIRRPKRLS